MKKLAIVIVVLVVAGYFGYKYYAKPKLVDHSMDNGDIKSNDLMTADQKARFLKENAGEDADGQSERKTTHGNISADGPAPASAAATASATPASAIIPGGPTSAPDATRTAEPVKAAVSTAMNAVTGSPASMSTIPATDSQAPNAPDGVRFGGSGTYQWYRQGNITYRVNTVTGQACVAFATDEEWRKPRVLSRGCGRNA